jgi:hypothetical protein
MLSMSAAARRNQHGGGVTEHLRTDGSERLDAVLRAFAQYTNTRSLLERRLVDHSRPLNEQRPWRELLTPLQHTRLEDAAVQVRQRLSEFLE